jgi:hypothetical protein
MAKFSSVSANCYDLAEWSKVPVSLTLVREGADSNPTVVIYVCHYSS